MNLPIVDAGLANDCLLTAAQAQALVSLPKLDPQQIKVNQNDGITAVACFYVDVKPAAPGVGSVFLIPAPVVRSQVYTTTAGATVATVMDKLTGTPLPGVGDRAVLVRIPKGTTLWIAAGNRIITILMLSGLEPSDQAFATSGRFAAAALATR